MRKLILIFIVFCSTILCGQEGQKEIATVLKKMEIQENCWNKGDIKGFMEAYWNSEQLMFIGSKGITYGWQKTLDNYLKSYPTKEAMGTLKFTLVVAEWLPNSCIYVVGQWYLKKEKPVGGYFTLLWKKITGHWVIVNDHTS
jgi:hypothetical protein